MLKTVSKTVPSILPALPMNAGMPVGFEKPPAKVETAILLAGFGTTVASAVAAIAKISEQVKKACLKTEVRIYFTSNIINSLRKKRRGTPPGVAHPYAGSSSSVPGTAGFAVFQLLQGLGGDGDVAHIFGKHIVDAVMA